MPLKLGIPCETTPGEKRVSIDPTVLSRLTQLGVKVFLQKGAYERAFFSESELDEAIIVEDLQELCDIADIIWRVQPPSASEVSMMREGSVLIGTLMAHNNIAMLKALEDQKISSYSMELIPHTSGTRAMDVSASQEAIAGYKAMLMAADFSPKLLPMLTTAAGTIKPAQVVIIGAGVAGLQAIATAKRLGAVVSAYDIRPEAKEQIESLGATAIELSIPALDKHGLPRELDDAEKHQQQQELAEHVANADILITHVSSAGRSAPKIIPQSMVNLMHAGAVIIDLAADAGGNCTLTKAGETISHHGVIIHGPLNVASQVPTHASQLYANNLFNFTRLLVDSNGDYVPNFENETVISALLTKDGEVMHEGTLELLNKTIGEKL